MSSIFGSQDNLSHTFLSVTPSFLFVFENSSHKVCLLSERREQIQTQHSQQIYDCTSHLSSLSTSIREIGFQAALVTAR